MKYPILLLCALLAASQAAPSDPIFTNPKLKSISTGTADNTNILKVDATTGALTRVTIPAPDLSGYALLDSPAFNGNPTAPTQSANNNSTRLATTAYADASSAAVGAAASSELGFEVDDLYAALDLKAPLSGPTFENSIVFGTGGPGADTVAFGVNTPITINGQTTYSASSTFSYADGTVAGLHRTALGFETISNYVTLAASQTVTGKVLTSSSVKDCSINGTTVFGSVSNASAYSFFSTTERDNFKTALGLGTAAVLNVDSDLATLALPASTTISAFGATIVDDADASASRTTLELGTLATQSGTFSGTSSGTNTGDQATIAGITGTTAQFNTALTDGDFATLAGTEPLSGKTLTAPKFATGGFIADANGNEAIIFTTTASATNELTIINAANGTSPTIAVSGSSDANVGLNLRTKGTGAFHFYGDAFTAPTTLGSGSIDFQVFRNNSANSASGAQSACVGSYNGKASAANSCVYGGIQPFATGTNSSVFAGYTNTASASYATALGGYALAASGAQSTAVGGQINSATAADSIVAGGKEALANRIGMSARASGKISTQGDAQIGDVIYHKQTTNATATELSFDGAAASGSTITTANRFIVGNHQSVSFELVITANQASSGNRAHYKRRGVIYKNATNATLVGLETIGADYESNAAWDIAVTADDTNKALKIEVTGAASTTINWVGKLEFVEVTSP